MYRLVIKSRVMENNITRIYINIMLILMSVDLDMFCWRLRSIMIFLHMSLRVLAIVRAGMSHLNTWHMCWRVIRSRATYAKSLRNNVVGLIHIEYDGKQLDVQ